MNLTFLYMGSRKPKFSAAPDLELFITILVPGLTLKLYIHLSKTLQANTLYKNERYLLISCHRILKLVQ